MQRNTFDEIAKIFAARRLSRRQALRQVGGAGLAAGVMAAGGLASAGASGSPAPPAAASVPPGTGENLALAPPPAAAGFTVLDSPPPAIAVATPVAASTKPVTFLFLQSFERGSLVPVPGKSGHFTLTLHQDLGGETIYFSDRPEKIVGTVPTQQFLDGLGFTPDNPPNAALIAHRDATHKDIVVLELRDPHYDATANTLTYDVTLLQDWHKLDEQFEQTPDDEQHLPRDFTAAHLFIDDCPDLTIYCVAHGKWWPYAKPIAENQQMCWNYSLCIPCEPHGHTQPSRCATWDYWKAKCNAAMPDFCEGTCTADNNWPFGTIGCG